MKFKSIKQGDPSDYFLREIRLDEDEFVKLWQKHCERIAKALTDAGYSYFPSSTFYPVIDDYGLVRFEFNIIWDKLSEIQKRIRENLPDQTSRERQAGQATSCLS